MNLNTVKTIHFVGLGGIGVSALARMMRAQGKEVSGSDRVLSQILDDLSNIGIKTHVGHSDENVPTRADLVVYSPAISSDNPELVAAQKYNIPILSYPQTLGLISENAFTIAVSGTHGKTTTTAMLAHVLERDISPTVIVGSLLKNQSAGKRSNFVSGHRDRFLVEACEYKRSFLNLHPDILVITNIDTDHLDYYKDLSDIQSAFNDVVRKVPEDGAIICDIEDDRVRPALKGVQARVINYRVFFDPTRQLSVIGEHNIRNAAAAHAVADLFEIDEEHINKMLKSFPGTWRRGEYKGTTRQGALIYDDYGHHPTEIQTTLRGFKKAFPDRKIIAIFQPHLYSRTKLLFHDFADAFMAADEIYVAPIYAAREVDDGLISHRHLRDEIAKHNSFVHPFETSEEIHSILMNKLTLQDLVLTIGAGDIYHIGERFLNE